MTKIVEFLKKLQKDERGVSALEYAVLIVVVIGIIAGAAGLLETPIQTLFGDAASALDVTPETGG